MDDFDQIRPYTDEELPGVINRLVADQELNSAATAFLLPRLGNLYPSFSKLLLSLYFRILRRRFHNITDFQSFLSLHMAKLIEETIVELQVDGLENLDNRKPYLFISNHRDIFMDAGLINFVIRQSGHDTARIAVGDNLLSRPFAADLIRLNKGFIVERSVSGARAAYSALRRTSGYIKQSLEEGHSVWIAQRQGRSKDGFDRTDPALIKMLALSHGGRHKITYSKFVDEMCIVPVAISYEIDPCDHLKAHELYITHRDGEYLKPTGEDLHSIVTGMTGFKGRVKLDFAPPLVGEFETNDSIANAIDAAIVRRLQVFPTHISAAKSLGISVPSIDLDIIPEVKEKFNERISRCPPGERELLLEGYANLLRNKQEINSG